MSAADRVTPEDVAEALALTPDTVAANHWFAEHGPALAREHAAASSALVALGQADDGRSLAERIGDTHTETMRHLTIARADVADVHKVLAATPRETAIGAARRARSTIEALRAEVARLTKEQAALVAENIADRDRHRNIVATIEAERDAEKAAREALREKARAVCELEWEGAWRLSDDDTLLFSALRAEVDR